MSGKRFERIECQPKLSICDINFGYTPKMEVYATLMLDIPELGEIGCRYELFAKESI